MYFSSASGAFSMVYEIDMNVTAPTEIYFNPEVWYPNGYKLTISHPKKGNQMLGTWATSPMAHYLNLNFFDIFDYNHKPC
jgi:hypothetical protein